MAGSVAVSKALAAGDIQLANFAAPAAIHADLRDGADFVVVLGAINRLMQTLMARPGITSLDELRGGVIGIHQAGEVDDFILRTVLPMVGLESDVRVEVVGRSEQKPWLMPEAPADALILHPPAPYDAEQAGWNPILDMRSLNVPFQLSCVTGSRAWIDEHRDLVRRYLRGHVEGLFRFKSDRNFAIDVLKRWSTTDDEGVISETYDSFETEFTDNPYPTVEGVANILKAMSGTVDGADTAHAGRFVDNSFITELDRSGDLDSLREEFGLEEGLEVHG
jgi:ABC-type nitrate/sulfonate/bicarbonate transport system substrate-binding protein